MAMVEESADTPQRWTAKRRAALVLSIVKAETSAQAAARTHGLTVAEIEEWRDRFLLAAENALRPGAEGVLGPEGASIPPLLDLARGHSGSGNGNIASPARTEPRGPVEESDIYA